MRFNYQARTKTGEIHAGAIEASSREAALLLLQKYGLYVTYLETTASPIYAKRIKIFEQISRKDIVLFSRQLSIMFKSRVPLIEALRVISSQTRNLDFKEKILNLSEEVEGGTAFSQALSRYPKIFSSFYCAMVRAGEASGKLAESLEYLAEHLEREYHLTSKIRGALIYPSLILFVVVIVLVILIFFVVPQLSEVLEGSGQPLPTVTRLVLGFTSFLREWWLVFPLGLFLLIFVLFRHYRTEKGKKTFDRIFLRLPMIGPLLKMVYITRFAENLSTLISGGLPIASALEIVGQIVGNTSYQEAIFQARDEVRRGEAISSVLSREPEIFPPVFVQMTLVGEKAGNLDTTLMNIVDFYREEINRGVDNLLSILEPVSIIFLGVIVAGLILSILMPLYQMITL